jgi:hypothetical protein
MLWKLRIWRSQIEGAYSLEIGTADLRGFSAGRICCGSFEFGEAKLKGHTASKSAKPI